jgi:hypothetical protein
MKIEESESKKYLHICDDGDEERGPFVNLTDENQRELVIWLWKNKPELIREVACENCPEIC